ncbi:MAG: CDP-alcohol phosphatidyltransferase family protein [Candidatus Magasanikbacteria bacterium]|jgi:CDP-diacylglycerol--glycerol-3-phosphate 3-phosphatidyltransferase|nr:CDP-alcohol phosphatidyltransferase family protein [Candidatus Magasanikbacteria bacterium]
MKLTSRFTDHHPNLFAYQPAAEVHPHDVFLSKTVLRVLPQWVTPNKMTTVRLLGIPVVVWIILHGDYLFGVILFLLLASTDALDGSLARTRNKITQFGMLYDPLADKLLIGSMVLVLVFQQFHYLLGLAVLGIEVAFILIAAVAKIKFHTVRAANLWGKIKMILQVIAIFFTLLGLLLSTPYLFTLAAWIFGLAIGFAILSLFSQGI